MGTKLHVISAYCKDFVFFRGLCEITPRQITRLPQIQRWIAVSQCVLDYPTNTISQRYVIKYSYHSVLPYIWGRILVFEGGVWYMHFLTVNNLLQIAQASPHKNGGHVRSP